MSWTPITFEWEYLLKMITIARNEFVSPSIKAQAMLSAAGYGHHFLRGRIDFKVEAAQSDFLRF